MVSHSQHKLVSGWWLWKRSSAPSCGFKWRLFVCTLLRAGVHVGLGPGKENLWDNLSGFLHFLLPSQQCQVLMLFTGVKLVSDEPSACTICLTFTNLICYHLWQFIAAKYLAVLLYVTSSLYYLL